MRSPYACWRASLSTTTPSSLCTRGRTRPGRPCRASSTGSPPKVRSSSASPRSLLAGEGRDRDRNELACCRPLPSGARRPAGRSGTGRRRSARGFAAIETRAPLGGAKSFDLALHREPLESVGLDLPHALARDAHPAADLLEGGRLDIAVQSVAELDDVAFA